MHKNTLKVIATIIALKGKEKDLQDVLLKLIEPTRKEPGCISYTLLNNIATQANILFLKNGKQKKISKRTSSLLIFRKQLTAWTH